MPEILPSGGNTPQNFKKSNIKENLFNTMDLGNNIDKKGKIYRLVNTLIKIYNEKHSEKITESQINQVVKDLSSFDIETIMDSLILKIVNRVNIGKLTRDDVLSNIKLLLDINPENFKSLEDVINRYNYLKTIGLDKVKITKNCSEILKENHENVIEVFDNFNKLVKDLTEEGLDYYYTGGLVGYLGTNTNLQRYHGDIDICINMNDLKKLRAFIQKKSDSGFKFIDNVKDKGERGHEYMIQYGSNPILIGLFLFKRDEDNKISRIEYDFDGSGKIITTESPMENVEIEDGEFNGTKYRRQSLKSLYNSKKDSSRPKDKYDTKILEEYFSKK